jgi:hypothetical protein
MAISPLNSQITNTGLAWFHASFAANVRWKLVQSASPTSTIPQVPLVVQKTFPSQKLPGACAVVVGVGVFVAATDIPQRSTR